MAEHTSYQYEFYQVSSDNQITGTEIDMYPVGSIVFNKKRREITVVSNKMTNPDGSHNNAIYGGGLASADVSEDGKTLQITDFQGHTLNFSLSNYVTTSVLATELAKYYTLNQVDTLLSNKADKSTTLTGYGITDAYTKDEIDNKITATEKQLFVLIGVVPNHDSLYDITAIDNGKIGGTSGKDFIPNGEVSDLQVGYVVQVENDTTQNYVEYWFTGSTTLYGINIGQNTLDFPTTIYISRPWTDIPEGETLKDLISIYDEDGGRWSYHKILKTGVDSLAIYEDNTEKTVISNVGTDDNIEGILYEASWNILGSQATSLEGITVAIESKVDKTTFNDTVGDLEEAIGNKVDTTTYNSKIEAIEKQLCWAALV
jgi:hypothetical protein